MKAIILICTGLWFFSYQATGQETWTCYTDDKFLLMNYYDTLGVFEYTDGTLWIITDRGINIFDGKHWKRIDNKSDTMNKSISSYLVDSKNQVWVGSNQDSYFGPSLVNSYNDGVVVYDGNTWRSMRTKDLGFKAPVVTNMFESRNGDIWLSVSSQREGEEVNNIYLAKGALLRLSNEEWIVYKAKDLPCSNCEFVKSFYEAKNGRLYIMAGAGLYYFEDDSFHHINKDEGYSLRNAPTAMFIDSKKNFWVGGRAKIAIFNGAEWQSFNRKNGLPAVEWPPIGFSETTDGKIIMTARNGIFHYDNAGQWHQERIKFLYGNSYVDKENRIWILKGKGLMIKEGEEITVHKDISKVWTIIEDKAGGVWALSQNDGAKRLKDGQWQLFNKDNHLPSDKILSGFVAKDGKIWIATRKGVCSCEYD